MCIASRMNVTGYGLTTGVGRLLGPGELAVMTARTPFNRALVTVKLEPKFIKDLFVNRLNKAK